MNVTTYSNPDFKIPFDHTGLFQLLDTEQSSQVVSKSDVRGPAVLEQTRVIR